MDIVHYHHWDVLAISCIDGRFIKRTVDWLTEKTGGIFDFRTGVGSSKSIIANDSDREAFFNVIRTAVKLHKVKEVWIIDHIDCGAYGRSNRFHGDCKSEEKFHIDKLKEASQIVANHFPELQIKNFYADWDCIKEIG